MTPIGGSEILYNNLIKYTGQDWQKNINLIMSFCDPARINTSKLNILWQHLMTDQGAVTGMQHSEFVDMPDHYVYVSNWQLNQFKDTFNINHVSNHVIKNAIEPIEYREKPTGKIRLIYTSMPDRGLEVLLDAFQIMNRDDVELVVYSSNIIYGKGYSDSRAGIYDHLFHRCKTTPGIIYKGYAMNKAVRMALQSSHILAYPSIYEETSCLAAIEAGAAGCKIVTTDLGALPETCDKWATYVPHVFDRRELAENYAKILNNEIDNYASTCYNSKEQSDWFNNEYSWVNRSKEWIDFFNKI